MKLINERTGETVRDGLTPADVRRLYAAGVRSMVGENAEAGGSGSGGAGEVVPTDREMEEQEQEAGAPGTGTGDPQEQDGESDGAQEPRELTRAEQEAIEDALEEMKRAERERRSGEWFGVGDADYEEADEQDQRRYDRLQKRIAENTTPMAQRRAERDAAMGKRRVGSETVREDMRESGLASEVENAFRKLKTADYPEPSDDGDELNLDGYIRHLSGDYAEDEFYLEQAQVETGDRAVAVALDMSGSMNERKAKVAMGALAVATRAIGDDLVASAYYTSNPRYEPRTQLITGPGEAFEWDHLDAIKTEDLTPTATGIDDAFGLLQQTTKREKLLIVVTDGIANVTRSGGDSAMAAIREAAEATSTARTEGVKVIGLGVGDVEPEMMDEIFGRDGYVMASMDDMADALVDVYRRQMKVDA